MASAPPSFEIVAAARTIGDCGSLGLEDPSSFSYNSMIKEFRWHGIAGPVYFLIVEADFDGRLDHGEIRRDIKVARCIK